MSRVNSVDRQIHRVGPIFTIRVHRVSSESVPFGERNRLYHPLLHATTYYGRSQNRIVDVTTRDLSKQILGEAAESWLLGWDFIDLYPNRNSQEFN